MKTNKILGVLLLLMLITAVSMISAVSAGNQNNARGLLITDEIINSKGTAIMTLTEQKTKKGSMKVDVNYMGIGFNGLKIPLLGGSRIVKIQQGDNGVLIITETNPSLPPEHATFVKSVESDLTAEDYYYNVYKPELIYEFLTNLYV